MASRCVLLALAGSAAGLSSASWRATSTTRPCRAPACTMIGEADLSAPLGQPEAMQGWLDMLSASAMEAKSTVDGSAGETVTLLSRYVTALREAVSQPLSLVPQPPSLELPLLPSPEVLEQYTASFRTALNELPPVSLDVSSLPISPELLASPEAGLAAVTLLLASTQFFFGGADAPYPEKKYDAGTAADYFRRRPLEVTLRALELGARSAGFAAGLLADLLGGKLEANADRRAELVRSCPTLLYPPQL